MVSEGGGWWVLVCGVGGFENEEEGGIETREG